MPPSAADHAPGQGLAVAAEALYLTNLMLAPGVAFLAIVWLWLKHRGASSLPALARCHLDQTFFVSVWGGVLLIAACAAILMLGGLDWEWTWIAVITYFTCVHSTLIVFGVVGLSKAMAGKPYRYPLIGPHC